MSNPVLWQGIAHFLTGNSVTWLRASSYGVIVKGVLKVRSVSRPRAIMT